MGGFAGSFVDGLAGGVQRGQQQAIAAGLSDLQMAHLKTTNKAAELALKMEQEKERLYGTLSPEEQKLSVFPKTRTPATDLKEVLSMFSAGQQEVPLPEYDPGSGTPPFRPGATMSVPQQIAQGQVGTLPGGLTMDDLVRGVMKKELGAERPKYSRTAPVIMQDGNPGTAPVREDGLIDLSKAVPAPVKADVRAGVGPGMAPMQTPVNPYTQQPMGSPVQTGPPPTMQVETPTAGGGKVRGVVPLFPGGGSKVTGTTSGGIRTELDLLDVPIPAGDITKWSDGKGGNPPMGWTPRQAQARNFKFAQSSMPAETAGKTVMVAQAITDIEVAENLLFPKPGQFNRKLAFGAQANLPEWMVKDAQTVQSALQNAIAAKLRIETGAQANDEEIKHIANRFFPSGVKDSEKSAQNKLTRLKQFMKDGKFIMDPQGRIVIVEGKQEKAKPDLGLGKAKDPSKMTDSELLKALQ